MEILQHKDGVLTERRRAGESTYIVKHFETPDSSREIDNYRILSSLNIPTLQVLSYTDCSITLEDIAASNRWRLGQPGDLSDTSTAAAIARWYRLLHERGRGAVVPEMYDESNLFTLENIRILPEFTKTTELPVWNVLMNHFDVIRAILNALPRTLTYNDFYWTNLAVSKDGSEAMMFDYNLMGKGYAYSDIRNVTVSLSPDAAQAFLTEYGPVDPLEKAADEVVSHITTLILASKRQTFPGWAEPSRAALHDIPTRIEKLIQLQSHDIPVDRT